MPPINKNNGLPKSNWPYGLVQQSFPQDRPIFWGPNQTTRFDTSEYNEPSGWFNYEPMRIPPVIRLFEGNNLIKTANRYIYLGYIDVTVVNYHFTNACPLGAVNFPSIAYKHYGTFNIGTEIQGAYNANMSSEAATATQMITTGHSKLVQTYSTFRDGVFSLIYHGLIGRTNTTYFCGATPVILDIPAFGLLSGSDPGGPDATWTDPPSLDPYDSSDPEIKYSIRDTVGNFVSDFSRLHVFLHNFIVGPDNPDSEGKTWRDSKYQANGLGYTTGAEGSSPPSITPETFPPSFLDVQPVIGLSLGII